jgi:hypothetical protein
MPRPHRSDPTSCVRSRSTVMPIFTYFAVAGSVLVASLFVMGPTPEDGTRAVVTSQRQGLPKPWHPDPTQIIIATPAPAPDMTPEVVLAAQPKSAVTKIDPSRRAVRSLRRTGDGGF